MSKRPTIPLRIRPERILGGEPVRSRHLVQLAARTNHLRGVPRILWPASGPPVRMTTHTTSQTYAFALVAHFGGGTDTILVGCSMDETAGSATIKTSLTTGTLRVGSSGPTAIAVGELGLGSMLSGVQQFDLSLYVPANSDVRLRSFWIHEKPNEDPPAGADLDAFLVGRPIEYSAALANVHNAAALASPAWMRRNLFSMVVPYHDGTATVGTPWLAFGAKVDLTQPKCRIVPRRISASQTRVRAYAYGYGDPGSAVLVDVGATTITVPLPASLGWASATAMIDAEQIDTTDGLPAASTDLRVRLDGTPGAAYMYTLALLEDE